MRTFLPGPEWAPAIMERRGKVGPGYRSSAFWLAMFWIAVVLGAALAVPAAAQELESFDPDDAYEASGPSRPVPVPSGAIDADLADPGYRAPAPLQDAPAPLPADVNQADPAFDQEFSEYSGAQSDGAQEWVADGTTAEGQPVPEWSDPDTAQVAEAAQGRSDTYGEDDLIGAAEGVFGKGAEGLARIIEDLLREQGEPNGYIVGREAGGAFIFGARYGSGTLHHKVEGTRKVYWTGPSVGFDAGANAANTFVLVYNLFDTEDIFRRYPAGEGQAYLVGGLHASYMRRGDVVLIPIRVGAGLRLGVNAGYMRFSKEQRWLPF